MINSFGPNFTRNEFACQCGCGFNTVDGELIDLLKKLRWVFKKPIVINSGCRCTTHNNNEGGSPTSQHLLGRAADIRIDGIHPEIIANHARAFMPVSGGIGVYDTFTHIDTRDQVANWDMTKSEATA